MGNAGKAQQLREAIESMVDARIAAAIGQYEEHRKSGAETPFRLERVHLNDDARRLQSTILQIIQS